MKTITLVVALFMSLSGAFGQTVVSDASGISVVQQSWKASSAKKAVSNAEPFAANDAFNQAIKDQRMTNIDNGERIRRGDSPNGPKLRPTVDTGSSSNFYSPFTVTYQIKVVNTAPKTVRELVWEYAFVDQASGKILSSYAFRTEVNINPGERDALKETSRFLPPISLNARILERIIIKKVVYADGTTWDLNAK